MINFFKKKENKNYNNNKIKLQLSDKFPWISSLEKILLNYLIKI